MKHLIGVLSALLLLFASARSHAETVRCESTGGDYRSCSIDGRGGVRLTRQLSSQGCWQGDTWGYDVNRIWVDRLTGVGILNGADCKAYGVTGPMIRAAGLPWDLRKAQPYSGYENYDFRIPTCHNGDTFDRYIIRMEEMRESVKICRQAVANLPDGPVMAKVARVLKPPIGEAYVGIEAPKGELGFFIVSDGTTNPYRVRVRPPSSAFCRRSMRTFAMPKSRIFTV